MPLEGSSAEYHAIRNFPVEIGRPFAVVDVERAHHVCVLGREVLRKLNVDDGIVGQTVLLDGQRFRVIGILEEKGSFLGRQPGQHRPDPLHDRPEDVPGTRDASWRSPRRRPRRQAVPEARRRSSTCCGAGTAWRLSAERLQHPDAGRDPRDVQQHEPGGDRRAGGDRRDLAPGRRDRDHERDARERDRADPRDRPAQGRRAPAGATSCSSS